jgi:hypothetical protein
MDVHMLDGHLLLSLAPVAMGDHHGALATVLEKFPQPYLVWTRPPVIRQQ